MRSDTSAKKKSKKEVAYDWSKDDLCETTLDWPLINAVHIEKERSLLKYFMIFLMKK